MEPKRRTGHACERCRARRTKCSGEIRCAKCVKDDAVCVYGDRKRELNKKYTNRTWSKFSAQQLTRPKRPDREHRADPLLGGNEPRPFESITPGGLEYGSSCRPPSRGGRRVNKGRVSLQSIHHSRREIADLARTVLGRERRPRRCPLTNPHSFKPNLIPTKREAKPVCR